MAGPAAIQYRLQCFGVCLRAEGDRLIAASNTPLTDAMRALIRKNKAALVRHLQCLTPGQEAAINRWLDHIGEHDAAARVECIDACQRDEGTLAYYLERAREVPRTSEEVRARLVEDLKRNPDLVRSAAVVDSESDPVRLLIAVRGVGTCELLVDRDRWDPIRFLELVESGGEAAS